MEGNLKIDISCLDKFNLSLKTKQYLSQEGLMDEPLLNMFFYQDCEKIKILSYSDQTFITIGGNEFMDWIFINEVSDQVCSINVERE